jgi:hypothetical protein
MQMHSVSFCVAIGLSVSLTAQVCASEVLYGIGTDADGSSNLYRIDDPLGSPAAADIGESGFGLFDMAISPITGKAYGIAGPTLFDIDLTTGQATPIGAQVFDGSQNALEFTPDGTLYSWGFEDTRLFRVDPETGGAEVVFDLQASAGGDLAAISDTLLYGTTGTALIEIDIAAGTRTLIGAHGGELGNSLLYGLELGADGNLVGLTGAVGEPSARMFSIDRQTGEATLVGDIAGSEALGGYGLAYAIPVPGAAVVLGLGGLVGLRRRRVPSSAPSKWALRLR